ncbi:GntR family transcriptional regulator [Streptomyces sp. CB02115]|nr:GntR family transcriptional regulator [Streptomyces sp. CB02115]
MERGVSSGDLSPGHVLPPMRELAARLEVNPNTVAAAYRTLRERGVIETAGRRGSRVRPAPVGASRGSLRIEAPPGVRDLGEGNPDPELLPDLGPALAAAAAADAASRGLYGQDAVVAEFTAYARAALDTDGVPAGPVAVTSGALDAIERVLAAHLRPGDAVAVEDPGWGSVLDLVTALGLRAVPVGVDDSGPVAADVERALRAGVRAIVVTDRAQNPTGASLDAPRARELRAVLGRHPDVLLIEDDHGHAIVDLPLHPLAGVTAHWAFIRSAAKAYGPDLRVATLTGDAVTVDRVAGRQRLGPGWVSRLLQRALLHLWTSDAIDTRAVSRSYGDRRDALIHALAERGVVARGRSGMNVWVPVSDETGAVARLLHAGWAAAPGARFRLDTPQGVRLTVSPLTSADIGPLADAVAAAAGPARPVSYG